ncbi:MAG: hypothetical protein EJNHJLOP_00012 [Methanophagales virus PBV082]|uniref:Uncharacterized protein n=1 Tax=Methanophagales virus PBV082 TaxID=3071307 RepID=A0AA46TDS5_9VIRU|nr:MAG: hypothetical protein QIT52_gp12 [Methanophagales virus PBV082]UYL64901.1 MAG: hypothetical protein EJNHJLOP_00012 [Methanophagales virus PBV082]
MSEERKIEEELEKVLKDVRVPYSVEIVIVDDKSGKVVFKWKRGRGNLVKGMQKTVEVLERKMGIPVKDLLK